VPSDTRSDRSVPVSVVGIHERSQSHSILRFDFDGFETREPRRDVIAPAFDGFWIASGEASRAASSTPPVTARHHTLKSTLAPLRNGDGDRQGWGPVASVLFIDPPTSPQNSS
jgi:hypothetical protein